MRWFSLALALLVVMSLKMCAVQAAESAKELLDKAVAAMRARKVDDALRLAGEAIAADPKYYQAYFTRALMFEVLKRHAEAVADYGKAIALDPKAPEPYNQRGCENFKLGRFAESIADFDKYLEMKPGAVARHWQRGLAYYYAGQFDEGAKQFERYLVIERNDVENSVWRYACMARSVGVDKARADLLKIENDRRVPMMEIYALFAGKAEPADLFAAVNEGKPNPQELNQRLFYAHVYLALFYEANGDKKKTLEHMTKAVEHPNGDYMWDVAAIHLKVLQKAAEGKK